MAEKEETIVQGSDRPIVTLADIPFENIQVGDRCRSLRETPGIIVLFNPAWDTGREKGYVEIEWDNGCISKDFIFLNGVPWLGRVEYIGPLTADV